LITPQWHPDTKVLRQFAVVSLFGFGTMAAVVWRAHGAGWPAALLAVFGVLVCVVGLLRPSWIRPIYVALLAISLPIGWVVSSLLLRIFFYGVVTPIGLLFRALRRDPLQLRRPMSRSYWQDHDEPDDPAGYFRQA
jgi:hypothetical protein